MKKRKTAIIVGVAVAGVAVLYFLYQKYAASQTSAATTVTTGNSSSSVIPQNSSIVSGAISSLGSVITFTLPGGVF